MSEVKTSKLDDLPDAAPDPASELQKLENKATDALKAKIANLDQDLADRKAMDGYVAKFHAIINGTKPNRDHFLTLAKTKTKCSMWKIYMPTGDPKWGNYLGVPDRVYTLDFFACFKAQVMLSSSGNREFNLQPGFLYESGMAKWVVQMEVWVNECELERFNKPEKLGDSGFFYNW